MRYTCIIHALNVCVHAEDELRGLPKDIHAPTWSSADGPRYRARASLKRAAVHINKTFKHEYNNIIYEPHLARARVYTVLFWVFFFHVAPFSFSHSDEETREFRSNIINSLLFLYQSFRNVYRKRYVLRAGKKRKRIFADDLTFPDRGSPAHNYYSQINISDAATTTFFFSRKSYALSHRFPALTPTHTTNAW